MKKQLLSSIREISEFEYFHVLGLNYNVKQLKSYLNDLKK
jgi:hypothetical protein